MSRADQRSALAARVEAENLAGALEGLLLEARRLATFASGVHGRRRAGSGEAFWQYRDHRPEDGARLVDWRRSGRSERLYVREREHEAVQTAWFWLDPADGFAWSSGAAVSKRRRGLVLALATALLANRGGERIAALPDGPPRLGPYAVERLAADLLAQRAGPLGAPTGAVVLVSDFYAPVEELRARLSGVAGAGARGALLMIADPAEEDFPFTGRTQFEGVEAGPPVLFGRAEAARDAYLTRLAEHRGAVRALAQACGLGFVAHRTDRPPAPALAAIAAALDQRS